MKLPRPFRFSRSLVRLEPSTYRFLITLFVAVNVLMAVTAMADVAKLNIPAPWDEVLKPSYGSLKFVAVHTPFNRSEWGKTLPTYYELGPQKQISVLATRCASVAEAQKRHQKEVSDSVKQRPEVLVYRLVKKGEHKDAAATTLGPWTLLESKFEGQFAEKAYWTQGEYLFEAEATIRDFRTDWALLGKDAAGKGIWGPPANGTAAAWKQIQSEEEKEQFLRGLVEDFLSAALKR